MVRMHPITLAILWTMFLGGVFSSGKIFAAEFPLSWVKTFDGGSADAAYGITAHRSSEVGIVWNRMFDSGQDDTPGSVAVDASGNVYVVGTSSSTTNDFRVIKYDTNGNVLWNVTYDSGRQDSASDVAIDPSGFVYVVGFSYDFGGGGSRNQDYRTIKYDTSGNIVWNIVYDSGQGDMGQSVAIDNSMNVYVAGVKGGDVFTIKYNPSGGQIWTSTHSAPGTGFSDVNAALGPSGNLYIGATFVKSDLDVTLFKVASTTGLEAWSVNHDSGFIDLAGGVAVDSSESPYLTYGIGGASAILAIRKYDSSGNFLWSQTYNQPSTSEYPTGIILDSSDNFYITGTTSLGVGFYDFVTLKYNSLGNLLWAKTYDSGGEDHSGDIGLDTLGNVYVSGAYGSFQNEDFRTIKYSPIDDVYVVGSSIFGGSNYDFQVLKYDSTGNFIWNRTYNSGGFDEARGVGVDSANNVYVAGTSFDSGSSSYDFRVIKYDSAGSILWNRVLNLPQNDYVTGLTIDSLNNVVLVGYSPGVSNNDYRVIKYDSSGTLIWNRTYNSGQDDFANAVSVDSLNNVYVVGYSGSGAVLNFLTVKYDSSGNEVWNRTYDSGAEDRAQGITVSAGSPYVGGYSWNGLNYDYRMIKYDSSGNIVWNRLYDSGSHDYAFSVTTDASSNIYITGYSGNGPTLDYRTLSYDSSGNVLWNKTFDSGSDDKARGATAAGSLGDVYVTGSFVSPSSATDDFLTIKYGRFTGALPACTGAISIPWTDGTIIANVTKIRKPHIYELRAWINNRRQDVGLSLFSWMDLVITPSVTKVRKVHFDEMRNAVGGIYTACGQSIPTWTDATITANTTKVRKVHIDELRTAISNAP